MTERMYLLLCIGRQSQQATELRLLVAMVVLLSVAMAGALLAASHDRIRRQEVSDAWVTRFLNRNQAHLTSKWTVGMDRNRHEADNKQRYRLYFALIHSKMRK